MNELSTEVVAPLVTGGLSAFYKEVEVYNTKIITNEEGKLDLGIEKTDSIKIITDKTGFANYLKRLQKKFTERDILDTEKVAFNKSSNYPRSMFNRYSDKARRVEKKEDVVVLTDTPGFTYGIVNSNWIGKDKLLNINKYNLYDSIRYSDTRKSSRIKSTFNSGTNYYDSTIESKVKKLFEEDDCPTTSDRLYKITSYNKKSEAYFKLVLSDYNIDNITTDNVVTKYIDGFKTGLDDNTYKMLHTALCNGDNNITMGLKLLENMNIDKNKANFYALIAEAMYINGNNVKNNPSFNLTGFRSIRDSYNLEPLTGSNAYYETQNTRFLKGTNNVFNSRLNSKEDKETFLLKIKDSLIKVARSEVGDVIAHMVVDKFTPKEEEHEDII